MAPPRPQPEISVTWHLTDHRFLSHSTPQTTARNPYYMAPHRPQPEISITWHLPDHNQRFLLHGTSQTTTRDFYPTAPHRPQLEIPTTWHLTDHSQRFILYTTARESYHMVPHTSHRLQPGILPHSILTDYSQSPHRLQPHISYQTHTHTHTHTHTTQTHTLTIIARFTVTRVATDKVCALPMATRVRSTVIDVVLTERAGKARQTLTAGLSRWHPTASAVVLTRIVFLTNVYLLTLTACTWRGYKIDEIYVHKLIFFLKNTTSNVSTRFSIVFRSISTQKQQRFNWLSF